MRLLLVLSLLCLSAMVWASDQALIIAIGDYKPGRKVQGLQGPVRDAQMMREVAGMLGFSPEQIRTLQDNEATQSNINKAFDALVASSSSQDRVLIYYSGHGLQREDLNGDEADGCDEALLTHDLKYILDDDIGNFLDNLAAQEILFIVDSCYSGTIVRGSDDIRPRFAVLQEDLTQTPSAARNGLSFTCNNAVNKRDVGVIGDDETMHPNLIGYTSAAQNEVAYDSPQGGFFTLALYQEIKNLRSRGGSINFQDLQKSVQTSLIRVAAQNQTPQQRQTPQLFGPKAWLNKDFFSFGTLSISPTSTWLPNLLETPTDHQGFFDILLNQRDVPLTITTNKDSLLYDSLNNIDIVNPQRKFALGEEIVLSVDTPLAGYLHIFEIGVRGNLNLIFPNQFNQSNWVNAGETITLPGPMIGEFRFIAIEPIGESQLLALVSTQELNLYNEAIGQSVGPFKSYQTSDLAALYQILADSALSRDVSPFAGIDQAKKHSAGVIRLRVY